MTTIPIPHNANSAALSLVSSATRIKATLTGYTTPQQVRNAITDARSLQRQAVEVEATLERMLASVS